VSVGGGGTHFSDPTVNGNLFTLSNPGGVLSPGFTPPAAMLAGNIPNNFDLIPVPAALGFGGPSSKFLVDVGSNPFGSSEVDVYDASTNTRSQLIKNISGPSASLAWNPLTSELYVENGNPSTAGQASIKKFTLAQLASGPVDWSAGTTVSGAMPDGTVVGSGMFFDSKGDLFTGTSNGLLVVTPSGNATLYDDSEGSADFASVFYDPATNGTTDQFVLEGFVNSPEIFSAAQFVTSAVPEPACLTALLSAGLTGLMFLRRRRVYR
jgi:hypothetical protein